MITNYQENKPQDTEEIHSVDTAINTRITGLAHFYVILLSILVSSISILLPVLDGFITDSQSQNLYTGLMMSRGILPYNDIFATGGLFYYAIIAVAYLLGSNLWLLVVSFIAYYLSGRYLYKIIAYLTQSAELAVAINLLFYLFNLVLGFGGLYPIQWAFPFLLSMIWFLIRYFNQSVKDERFILFGITSALGLFIEPRLVIFGLIASFTILAFNIRRRFWARGLYQALSFIFGTILIVYTMGYFIFNEQLLTEYLKQPGLFYLSVFETGNEKLFISIPYQIGLLLFSGLLFGIGQTDSRKDKPFGILKVALTLSILVYGVYAILSKSLDAYHLLFILVQGLILISLQLASDYQSRLHNRTHRRSRRVALAKQFFFNYFTKTYLLPVVILIGLCGQLGYHYFEEIQLSHDRQEVAKFIKNNSAEDSSIYVWDDLATIYLNTERQSASKFSLPYLYTVTSANRKNLEDDLLQDNASYIVLAKNANITDTLKDNLSRHYDAINIKDVAAFTVYQIK